MRLVALTEKQKRFCDEYLIDLNATQAAIRAGYSEKTARQTATENLSKPYIREYIDKRLAEKDAELIADQDEVLKYLTCLQPPIIAYEETKKVNGAVVSHRSISSLSIPINISSLSGTSGYICFEFPEVSFPSNATELTFSVSSNRGKVFEKKLPLGRPLH